MENSFVVMTDPKFGGSNPTERRELFEDRVQKYCRGVEYLFVIGRIAGDLFTDDERKTDIPKEELENRTRQAYRDMKASLNKLKQKKGLPTCTRVLSDTSLTNHILHEYKLEYSPVTMGGKVIVGLGSQPLAPEYSEYGVSTSRDAELDLLWNSKGERKPDIIIVNTRDADSNLTRLIMAHRKNTVPNPGLHVITRQPKIDHDGEIRHYAMDTTGSKKPGVTGFKESGITTYTMEGKVIERLRHRFIDEKLKCIGRQHFDGHIPVNVEKEKANSGVILPYQICFKRLSAELEFAFADGNAEGLPEEFLNLREEIKIAFMRTGNQAAEITKQEVRKESAAKIQELENLLREKSEEIMKGAGDATKELKKMLAREITLRKGVQEELGRNLGNYSDHVQSMQEVYEKKVAEVAEADKLTKSIAEEAAARQARILRLQDQLRRKKK